MINRRELLIASAAAALIPASLLAQTTGKMPRIGVLLLVTSPEQFLTPFRDGMRQLGYVEGKTFAIEPRTAAGKIDALPELAAELVRLKVDIIVAQLTPAVVAAKRATTSIPIVMAPAGDPVQIGLIASLARPGGNVTGISAVVTDLGGKFLQLMTEVRPNMTRIALLAHATDSFTKLFAERVESAAKQMHLQLQTFLAHGDVDLDTAFSAIARERIDAGIIQPTLASKLAAELALKYRLPAITGGPPTRVFTEAGGLIGYGANPDEHSRGAAVYIEKLLKGAQPATLPVEQPTKFEMVVNLKTAKALGIKIPNSILLRADKVIE